MTTHEWAKFALETYRDSFIRTSCWILLLGCAAGLFADNPREAMRGCLIGGACGFVVPSLFVLPWSYWYLVKKGKKP